MILPPSFPPVIALTHPSTHSTHDTTTHTQRFRIRNTALERRHGSARETLEYAVVGRHLGFCCDRCGATDFTGPRYKCRCVGLDIDQGEEAFCYCGCAYGPHIESPALTTSHTHVHSVCNDYDLCQDCRTLPVEKHRYRFGGRQWTREEYDQHSSEHVHVVIQPLPRSEALLQDFLWRQQQQQHQHQDV